MDDIDIARRAISDTIEALKQVVAKMKPMSDKKFGDFTIREISKTYLSYDIRPSRLLAY